VNRQLWRERISRAMKWLARRRWVRAVARRLPLDRIRGMKAIKTVHGWLEAIRLRVQPRLDKLLAEWEGDPDAPEADFVRDADYFIAHQEPLRARLIIKAFGWVLALFFVGAAITNVDEVTKGDGKVIPTRQLQVLQSLDGGIVSDIQVREGQVVEAGQVLLRVDPTRFISSVGENRAQYLSLAAKVARLQALADDKPFEAPQDVQKESPQVAVEEHRLYDTAKSNLEAQLSIARQQLAQRQQEFSEMRAKRDQAARSYELTNKELVATRPLLSAGAVSEVDLLHLERDLERFRGERDQASAQISRTQAAIEEANHKIEEVQLSWRNDIRKDLADSLAKLNATSAGGTGLADKVKHSVIRSPVRGTVKRLLVNTVGGVVQPGKDVVEIVPLEDNLLLEAKVAPKDIGFLRPGQRAMVKFTAYDFSIYGGLEGTLENVGADSITDERGNTYYLVRVKTDKASLGPNLPIIPGMMAEVDIITGHKSILAYLLKPVLRAKQAAFTER
jgi:adhesin transport system membrane fusion protein